jgi:hypothetical protein
VDLEEDVRHLRMSVAERAGFEPAVPV